MKINTGRKRRRNRRNTFDIGMDTSSQSSSMGFTANDFTTTTNGRHDDTTAGTSTVQSTSS